MTLTSFSEIPRGVLASLLDLCGEAGDMSPRHLMGEAEPLNPLQIAQLYAGGYLSKAAFSRDAMTPQFRRAARVLLDPRTNLTFRIWGSEDLCAESNVQFPGDVVDGGGVMLLPVSGSYRISAFVEPEDIIRDLAQALPPDSNRLVNPFLFEGQFDAAVAAVLFALVDLQRASTDRRQGFSSQDIFGYLHGQWGMTGFSQLLTYVQTAGMQSRPPQPLEVDAALAQLEAAGTIRRFRSGHCQVSDDLRPLVDLTRSLVAGLQWQRVTRLAEGDRLVNSRIYAYGDGGLTLCFIPTIKGRLYVGTVDYKSVLDFVIEEVGGLMPDAGRDVATPDEAREQASKPASAPASRHRMPPVPPPAPDRAPPKRAAKATPAPPPPVLHSDPAGPKAAPPPLPPAARKKGPVSRTPAPAEGSDFTCHACGAPLKKGQKFCPNCGAEAVQEPEPSTCPSCGHPVKPGARFCTHCGHKFEATKPDPVCPSCGRSVKPGAKFCTGCGAKL
ncbi:zinc ribbon domain-containing protein [Zhengella sp. ZM62]|uniref:zinc ribbon domain-containing protein n=1 Tax=Zhengella sedimenti TaxID=3390035 RepID=UPI003976C72E